jgi:hypothetical protein
MSAGSIGNRALGVASALNVGFMEGERYHTQLHSCHRILPRTFGCPDAFLESGDLIWRRSTAARELSGGLLPNDLPKKMIASRRLWKKRAASTNISRHRRTSRYTQQQIYVFHRSIISTSFETAKTRFVLPRKRTFATLRVKDNFFIRGKQKWSTKNW